MATSVAPPAPATPAAAPGGTSGSSGMTNSDIGNQLDSILGGDVSADADEPIEESIPEIAEPEESGETTVEPVEETPQPGEVEASAEDENLDENGFPIPDAEKGDLVYYKKGRLEKWNAAAKTLHELEREIPGFSIDRVRELNKVSRGYNNLMEDFRSGDPANYDKIIGHFHRTDPQALGKFALRMAAQLPQADPNAYGVLRDHISKNFLQDAAEAGRKAGNANVLNAARWLHKELFGNDLRPGQAPQQDPLAHERRQIEQERQQLQQERQQSQNDKQQAFEQSLADGMDGIAAEEIEKALKPLEQNWKQTNYWSRINRDVEDVINQAMEDPSFVAGLGEIKRAVLRTRGQADVDRLNLYFRQNVQRAIRANIKRIANDYGALEIKNNQALHAQLTRPGQKERPGAGEPARPQADSVVRKLANPKTNADLMKLLDTAAGAVR